MTPEQRARLAELRAKQAQLQAQQPAPEPEPGFDWRGAAQSALQGLSMGWGDELVSGGIALASRLNPDETRSMGDVYRDVLGTEAEGLQNFRENSPVLAGATEVGGALLTAPWMAARGLSAATRAAPQLVGRTPRIVAPVAAGAAEGSIYGAGAAAPGSRAEGAATGAAVGAAAGGVMGLVQKALTKPAGWLLDRMRAAPTSDADRVVLDKLAEMGFTPQTLRDAVDQYGPDVRLADLQGPMGALGDLAASTPSGAKYLPALEKRHRDQFRTISRVFEDVAGRPATRQATEKSLRKLYRDAAEEVRPIYRDLKGTPVLRDGVVRKILSAPGMRDVFRRAKRIARYDDILSRRDRPQFDLTWNQVKKGEGKIRIEHVDYLQRALRDMGEAGKRGKKYYEGPELLSLRRELLADIDPSFPDFRHARKVWAGMHRIRKAAEQGRRFNRLDDLEFDKLVGEDVSQAEKHAFLMGMHDYLRGRLGRIRKGRDLTVATEFDTPEFERRMQLLLGPKKAQALRQRLEIERQKAITYGRTRNSMTYSRQAMEREMRDAEGVSQITSDLMTGNIVGAGVRGIRDALTREGIDPMMMDRIASLTLDTNPLARLPIERMPGTFIPAAGPTVRGPAAAGAGGMALYNSMLREDPRMMR